MFCADNGNRERRCMSATMGPDRVAIVGALSAHNRHTEMTTQPNNWISTRPWVANTPPGSTPSPLESNRLLFSNVCAEAVLISSSLRRIDFVWLACLLPIFANANWDRECFPMVLHLEESPMSIVFRRIQNQISVVYHFGCCWIDYIIVDCRFDH